MNDSSSDTRELIMRSAREIFALNGYHGTSVDSIIKRTGVSKGALYWHFKGKMGLYKAVMQREILIHMEILRPAEEIRSRDDLKRFYLERGLRLIDVLIEDRISRMLWFSLLLEAHRGNEELAEIHSAVSEMVMEELLPILSKGLPGIASGSIGLSLREMVLVLSSTLSGLMMNLGTRITPDLLRRTWKLIVELVFDAEGGKFNES